MENIFGQGDPLNIQPSTDSPTEETPEALKEKLAQLEKEKDELHGRATRAEAKVKELSPQEKESPKQQDGISTKDLYALMEHKVPQEDLDEVVQASKILGKSVSEALKSNVVKSLLSARAEERRTAQATNIGQATPKAPRKVSDDDVLYSAREGDLPESDEDISKLMAAKQKSLIGK